MIEVHHDELDGLPVVWRSAPSTDPPTLWLHGVPDHSELWTPFLEQAGGIAPDLPGFGATRQARRPRLHDRGLRRLAGAVLRPRSGSTASGS